MSAPEECGVPEATQTVERFETADEHFKIVDQRRAHRGMVGVIYPEPL